MPPQEPLTKTLVIGAAGQIGSELVLALRQRFGAEQVLAADLRLPLQAPDPFIALDVLDREALRAVVRSQRIGTIYNLAAILSARGEQDPVRAWQVNMDGLLNTLEVAREFGLRVFWPSSIAVFGPGTPSAEAPQFAHMDPETVYGISKLAGERWCEYYWRRYGVDVRSLRYPGLVSFRAHPGGGTTDYAVSIFHAAASGNAYTCYLSPDTRLPMMYMPDAIRATLLLMDAPSERITVRSSYNISGMSFTPSELAAAIRHCQPGFEVSYAPDFRQQIADSWPDSIEDAFARNDWGWAPAYHLEAMTAEMLAALSSSMAPAR